MIHLCIFDITDLSYTQLREHLPQEEISRLDSKKSDAYRRASATGRIAAASLFYEVFHRPSPPVVVSKDGAPSFFGETCSVSISHAENLVAVAISDEGRIGVDIENHAFVRTHSPERQARIRDRLRLEKFTSFTASFPYRTLALTAVGPRLSEPKENISVPSSAPVFLEQYTAFEAVIKADGRGFFALSDADFLSQKYSIHSGILSDKKEDLYTFSIAF